MKILFFTNYFPPEIAGSAHLFYELSTSLAEKGHQVTVVTGFPRYNAKHVDRKYRGRLLYEEEVNGVRLLRVRTIPFPVGNKIARGLDHFALSVLFAVRGLFSGPHDAVLVYSPPLPLGLSAWFLSHVRHMPFVVNIQDLFPREAIELGLMTNPLLIHAFEAIESFIYRRADKITVHSPGNAGHVAARGGDIDRVCVLHNWVDTERIVPGNRDNAFTRQHGLLDHFVISYAGTMGWCQDMDTIVRAAGLLKEYKDMLFLMVGDGVEKPKAQQLEKELGVSSIVWVPMQPWEIYPQILAASHVSMINLNENLQTPVVPSKLLNIMAAGRPVVASLPLSGDAPRIIETAGAGLCVEPNKPEALASALLRMYQYATFRRTCGTNARRYAEKNFSRKSCVRQYERIFMRLKRG